jgi:diguanylate cyclase (GGDEF)-like protein
VTDNRAGTDARRAGRRQPWAIWGFTAALVAAVVGIWFGAADHLSAPASPTQLPWLLLAAGFAAADVMVIRFEFREEAHSLTLGDIPLLVGLVFTQPNGLMLAAVVGFAASIPLHRRQAPVKAVFNLAVRALTVVVALVCYHGVLGGASAISLRGWLAILVATLTVHLISGAGVLAVIALSVGRPQRGTIAPLLATSAVVATINAALGVVAISVLWANSLGLLLFVGIGAVFGVGYRAHTTLRRRHNDLEQLYRFSRALAELVEADDVVAQVLTEAKALLRCEVAELSMPIPRGVLCHALGPDGQVGQSLQPGPDTLQQLVERLGHGIRISQNRRGHGLSPALSDRGFRDAMVAPVPGEDGAGGVLLVANRLGDQTTFEEADLHLLETLAAHSAVVLRSSELLDRLRQEAADRQHQALHDSLTGLANRTLFSTRLDAALAARVEQTVVAVMLIDLDGFKEVNDTLGHHTGDSLLQKISVALVRAVGGKGLVARLGGDEFAIVIPNVTRRADVAAIAQDTLTAAERPVLIDGLALEVRASLGVALAPDHGDQAAALLRQADIAMYQAKTSRSGIEVYDPEEDHYTTRRLILVTELSRAMQASTLRLHYQPIAELGSGRIIGAEALLRWTHPLYGDIPPDEFIPVAEQSGLIRPLTRWVLQTALEQAAEWHREGLNLTIAVNLSARSVVDTQLVAEVAELIAHTGFPPSGLTLELTESSLPTDRGRSVAVLGHLNDLGVRLAVDDFGTGYSSLSRLRHLPVHEVKVDKSFVLHMVANDDDDVIVRSTIELTRSLGLRVVAEGVEDEATWRRLLQLGCHAAQGFFVSEPLSGEDFLAWMAQRQPRRMAVIRPLRGAAVNL